MGQAGKVTSELPRSLREVTRKTRKSRSLGLEKHDDTEERDFLPRQCFVAHACVSPCTRELPAGAGAGGELGTRWDRDREAGALRGDGPRVTGWRAGGRGNALHSPARSARPAPGPHGSVPTCPGGGRWGGSGVRSQRREGVQGPVRDRTHPPPHPCKAASCIPWCLRLSVCKTGVGPCQDPSEVISGTKRGF